MKKSYKIILVCVLVGLFIYSIILAVNSSKKSSAPTSATNTLAIPVNGGQLQVSDFTKQPVEQVGGTTALAETPGYDIVYFIKDKSFLITLLDKPLQQNRDLAEQKLLDKLNISFTDACKLKVSLSVPASVDENLAGTDYGLSFCPNGLHF